MKLSYDSRYNIAYIRFREKAVGVETIQLSDEINIDLGADGKLYGIELLNANEQLKEDAFRLLVSDEATGFQSQLSLTAA